MCEFLVGNKLKEKNDSLDSDLAGMFKEVDPELQASFITILREEMISHNFLAEEIGYTIGYVLNERASAGQ